MVSRDGGGSPWLPPSAGYPGPTAAALDPAMARGYRIGDTKTVANGATELLANHGHQDHYFRWKVTLGVRDADGVAYTPNTAYTALFNVLIKVENDRILRRCAVPRGGGQVLYAPGRFIDVSVTNAGSQPLQIDYNLDEATPGLSSWSWFEDLAGVVAETELDVPEFCTSAQIFTPTGSAGFTLRGYGATGALVYFETLFVPRSGEIALAPGLLYTVQNVGPGAQDGHIHYRCVG